MITTFLIRGESSHEKPRGRLNELLLAQGRRQQQGRGAGLIRHIDIAPKVCLQEFKDSILVGRGYHWEIRHRTLETKDQR